MKLNLQKSTMETFIKVGCTVCSLMLVLFASYHYLNRTYVKSVSKVLEQRVPIHCVDTKEKKVALSFDATLGDSDVGTILSILEKYNLKTTFFMTGSWVEKYPEDVKKISDAGHDLGNYSQNNKDMSQLDEEACISEIKQNHEKVKELTGKDMTLFRPPHGYYNNQVVTAANDLGYDVVQWSVDSLDWKDYGADHIIATILNDQNLDNGAIILLHSGAKYTKDALERVITGLQDMGYEIVPVSELIYTGDYHTDDFGKQFKD